MKKLMLVLLLSAGSICVQGMDASSATDQGADEIAARAWRECVVAEARYGQDHPITVDLMDKFLNTIQTPVSPENVSTPILSQKEVAKRAKELTRNSIKK